MNKNGKFLTLMTRKHILCNKLNFGQRKNSRLVICILYVTKNTSNQLVYDSLQMVSSPKTVTAILS